MFYIASVKTFSGTRANHTKSWILNCYLYQYACRDLFPICHDWYMWYVNRFYSEKWRTIKICAMIDICDMLIVWFRFVFCILDYIWQICCWSRMSLASTLELCAVMLLLLYRLSIMVSCICDYLCNPCWHVLVHWLIFLCW